MAGAEDWRTEDWRRTDKVYDERDCGMDETGMDYGVGDGEGLETRYNTVNFCKLGGRKAGTTEKRWRRGANGSATRWSEGLRPLCVCEC